MTTNRSTRRSRQKKIEKLTGENKTLKAELKEMKSALQKAGGSGRWRSLRRRERGQIWLWALVYLFWQLVPSYIALANWITGRAAKNWVKTPRTRKTEGISSN